MAIAATFPAFLKFFFKFSLAVTAEVPKLGS